MACFVLIGYLVSSSSEPITRIFLRSLIKGGVNICQPVRSTTKAYLRIKPATECIVEVTAGIFQAEILQFVERVTPAKKIICDQGVPDDRCRKD